MNRAVAQFGASIAPIEEQPMGALTTLAIYLVPFLVIGIAAKLLMKRRAVDLSDVQAQAGPNRRKHRAFLLGAWRTED